MAAKKSQITVDFLVYAGDPDAGAEAVPSEKAVAQFDQLKGKIPFQDGVYGALVLYRDGKRIVEPLADPLVSLLNKTVRCLPYVLEGEPESVLLSESENGWLFEPANEDVQISVFKGNDPFEPEGFILEKEATPMTEFCDQVVVLCDRLVELLKRNDPAGYEADDLNRSFLEMLNTGRAAVRKSRLEKERGLLGRR